MGRKMPQKLKKKRKNNVFTETAYTGRKIEQR